MAKPAFDAVTGVSTGALIAPFAFLGDEPSIDTIEGCTATRKKTGSSSAGRSVQLEQRAAAPVTVQATRHGAAAQAGGEGEACACGSCLPLSAWWWCSSVGLLVSHDQCHGLPALVAFHGCE